MPGSPSCSVNWAQDNDSHAAWDAYFTMLATPLGASRCALGSRTFQVESWRALVDELGQALSMTAAFLARAGPSNIWTTWTRC